MVGKIEKHHEERYLELLKNIEEDHVFEEKKKHGYAKNADIFTMVKKHLKFV